MLGKGEWHGMIDIIMMNNNCHQLPDQRVNYLV